MLVSLDGMVGGEQVLRFALTDVVRRQDVIVNICILLDEVCSVSFSFCSINMSRICNIV